MSQKEATSVNVESVRSLLGGENLRCLIERLRKRMLRGQALKGKLQIGHVTSNERSAIDKLMGRLPTQGSSLTIDLDKLAEILNHAKASNCLEEAVAIIVGPVTNERLQSLSRQEQWERLWRTSADRVEGSLVALRWLDDLKGSGLLKRIVGRDLVVASRLLDQGITVVKQIPLPGVRISEIAASITGNSHALDRGQPLGTVVIRFARQLSESVRWNSAAERREAWRASRDPSP